MQTFPFVHLLNEKGKPYLKGPRLCIPKGGMDRATGNKKTACWPRGKDDSDEHHKQKSPSSGFSSSEGLNIAAMPSCLEAVVSLLVCMSSQFNSQFSKGCPFNTKILISFLSSHRDMTQMGQCGFFGLKVMLTVIFVKVFLDRYFWTIRVSFCRFR
jgi:hypothetical protein